MRKALSLLVVLASIGVVAPVAPVRAEDADTACSHWHADPAPHYTGPVPVGLICEHALAPVASWTVPSYVTTARFIVDGADDPITEANGGYVDARLDLTPGSILTLEMGGEGESSAVSFEGAPLIVAGGGSGADSNFVTPSATEVEAEDPGGPETSSWPQDGRIWVEWTYFYEGEDTPEEPSEGEIRPSMRPPQPPGPPPACVVPSLKGLRPIAARRVLAQANCALGRVLRRAARPHRRGRIIRQVPPVGVTLLPGAAVAVVVGRRP